MTVEVLSTQEWTTNASLIADVAKIGYLEGRILDCTFGHGAFWTEWMPSTIVGCDLDPDLSPIGRSIDFRNLPWPDREFDSVVFDPPYKLNGTPDPAIDKPYGVHIPTRWQDRMQLILDGAEEAARVADKFLLVKCQDQVCSGKVRWQTDEVAAVVTAVGFRKRDRFNFLSFRSQGEGKRKTPRVQRHARQNYSTLLVFERN